MNSTTANTTTDADYAHILQPFPLPFLPVAAIFDCDGTIANTMPLHYRAWNAVLAEVNCPFPEETFYAWGGVTTNEILRRLSVQHNLPLDIKAVAHAKEEAYRAILPGVTPLLPIIEEARRFSGVVPIAVASGGLRDLIETTLEALQIRSLFQAVVTADDVTHGKPAPETFLLAAERLGVRPEDCVVYEDSPTGFEAAFRAGMRAVDVRPYVMHISGHRF